MAAADHGERLGGIEDRRPGLRGDGLFTGVNHVGVDGFLIGKFAHPQQAVLRLEHHFNAGGNVVGHQRRDTDPEVDVVAIAQLWATRIAICSRVSISVPSGAQGALFNTFFELPDDQPVDIDPRSMDGGGGSSPGGTISSTSTTVMRPAVAISGLKFCAVWR